MDLGGLGLSSDYRWTKISESEWVQGWKKGVNSLEFCISSQCNVTSMDPYFRGLEIYIYSLVILTKTGSTAPVLRANSRCPITANIALIAPEWLVIDRNVFPSVVNTSSRNFRRRVSCSWLVSRWSASHKGSSSAKPGSMSKSGWPVWMIVLELRRSHVCTPKTSRTSCYVL